MAIVLVTQVLENYGADEGLDYWKPKGGDVWVITGASDSRSMFNAVARMNMRLNIACNVSDYYQEFVVDWRIQDAEDVEGHAYTMTYEELMSPRREE